MRRAVAAMLRPLDEGAADLAVRLELGAGRVDLDAGAVLVELKREKAAGVGPETARTCRPSARPGRPRRAAGRARRSKDGGSSIFSRIDTRGIPRLRRRRERSGSMNRFAELLDALLFTPSRNGKLRLMQEYFATDARPGARLGAGGADRRTRLCRGEAEPGARPGDGAGRSRAVRLVLGFCRRPRRDRGADLAGAAARPDAAAHGRRASQRDRRDVADARAAPRSRGHARAAGSTGSTRPGAGRC